MFCRKCGENNPVGTNFCGGCGARIEALSPSSPAFVPANAVNFGSTALVREGAPSSTTFAYTSAAASSEQMTFSKSISTCMGKFVDFHGRASRSEYWWFYLFTIILSWGSLIVDQTGIISGVVNLALLLPAISAAARRLHDTDRSAWWMLISFTVVGLVPLIIWLASRGTERPNEYGNPV